MLQPVPPTAEGIGADLSSRQRHAAGGDLQGSVTDCMEARLNPGLSALHDMVAHLLHI